jgi:predicted tellurium resistance membrane protein TerC
MEFFTLDYLITFFTLSGLEIVLGIDNVIFIALLVHHLQKEQRKKARLIGLSLALVLRVLMLFGVAWIIKLKDPLFRLFNFDFSGRSLLLILGGLFLIVKSGMELVDMFGEAPHDPTNSSKKSTYWKTIGQIVFIDLILSFDSIITAVGMTEGMPHRIPVIITVIFIAMIIMLLSAKQIGEFIYKYQSIKVIALMFIVLVGVMLFLNGFDIYFDKGYIYFAMIFTLVTELINIMLHKKKQKIGEK